MKDIVAPPCQTYARCIAWPILLAVGSSGLLLGIFSSEWFHYLMLLPIGVLLAWSLPGGWCVHQTACVLK